MAQKKCQRCGEEKNMAAYIAVNSIIHGGSLPICRQCLAKQLDQANLKNNLWNVADKICQWADVPFIPEKFNDIYRTKGKDAIGFYIAIFRGRPYDTLDWGQYNEVYLQLKEEERVEDALPEIKETQHKKLIKKWGDTYDNQELEYLENLHQGLINSQNIVGALNEDQALKLCKISLIIERKISMGEEFDKDLKAYENLSKLANLTPKSVQGANEINSTGELCSYLEKKGIIVDYDMGEIRDEADYALKDIKLWNQALYVGESKIQEEIDQKIQNLKIASELTGSNFDEKEFRDYLEKQNETVIDEIFEVEI